MGRQPNNQVWEYFDYISDYRAKCRVCKKKLATPGKSRGSMVRHLLNLHGINIYTAAKKRVPVMKTLPSTRGQEFPDGLRDGDTNVLRRFEDRVSIDSNSLDIKYNTQSSFTQADEDDNDSHYNYSQHDDNVQVINEVEPPTLEIPLVNTASLQIQKEEKHFGDIEANDQDDNEEQNMSLNDPLINVNVQPLKPRTTYSSSDIDNHHQPHNTKSNCPTSDVLEKPHAAISSSQNNLEKLQAKALTEKLKAEARYFNELAELTRSKRIFVDLQSRKLRNELKNQFCN